MAIDFKKAKRAYALIEGKWRHVYIVATYTQVDIFGENSEIASVLLTQKSKDLYDVPVNKLETKRPSKRSGKGTQA